MSLKEAVEKRWYAAEPGILRVLFPLEAIFRSIASQRRRARVVEPEVHIARNAPLVVVGNLSVGGTGKTPVIVALVNLLQSQGIRVGVVSRGYGRNLDALHHVTQGSKPEEAGDEPLEIFRRCACDVVVHAKRNLAVDHLIQNCKPEVILSDDGLQHYAMSRQMEIVVVNKQQGFGNGHCLPVGPLREPVSRLSTVDFILVNDTGPAHQSLLNLPQESHYEFKVSPVAWVNVRSGERQPLAFKPGQRICAYAGIGQPRKFFSLLEHLGLSATLVAKPDHARYQPSDFQHSNFDSYVMTAKDAVKCGKLAPENAWYLEVKTELPAEFTDSFLEKLRTYMQ